MDLVTLACAEDMFKILYVFNQRLTKEFLGQMSFDHQMTGWFFQSFFKKFRDQLNFESFERLSEQAIRLNEFMKENDLIRKEVHKEVFQELETGSAEAKMKRNLVSQEVNEILHQLYIHYSIYKFVQQEKEDAGVDVN